MGRKTITFTADSKKQKNQSIKDKLKKNFKTKEDLNFIPVINEQFLIKKNGGENNYLRLATSAEISCTPRNKEINLKKMPTVQENNLSGQDLIEATDNFPGTIDNGVKLTNELNKKNRRLR